MNSPSDLPQRFRRLLTGEASEEERIELERAILEDDELFQQLSVIETELVDAFVHQELDTEAAHRVGRRIETSPRLQAMAETTLALETWYGDGKARDRKTSDRKIHDRKPLHGEAGEIPQGQQPRVPQQTNHLPASSSRSFRRVLAAGALALLLGAAWVVAAHVASLNRSIRVMERELADLQRDTQVLEETVTDLQDLNRTLALRVARMEATAGDR